MDISVQSSDGAADNVQVSDAVFAVEFNEPLVHQVVTAYLAGARSGTKAQKSRSDVRGGGAKPWRQKGTGRARAGTIRSPIWRSGGVTFAARPRCYKQKVNRKMYRGAVRSILSELLRQQRLIVVDDFTVDAPKTKQLVERLKALGVDDALIVSDSFDENLMLAARNLYHVDTRLADDIDPPSLMAFEKVVVTANALKAIEERLS